MGRTVEDATKVIDVIAGYDPEDPLTKNSKGKSSSNYNQFLLKDGLDGARIGVLREPSDDNPHPEIKVLFERALVHLDSLDAYSQFCDIKPESMVCIFSRRCRDFPR